jgi:hypothetical protein
MTCALQEEMNSITMNGAVMPKKGGTDKYTTVALQMILATLLESSATL